MIEAKDLEGLTDVSIPEDVGDSGLKELNGALWKIQGHNSKATLFAVKTTMELKDARKERDARKAKVEISRGDLLATDEDVKKGKNREEREALANGKIKKDIIAFEKAELKYREIQSVLNAIEYVLSYLKSAKEIAGHSLNILQKEMDLGLVSIEDVGQ